jgi:hypothetical protein
MNIYQVIKDEFTSKVSAIKREPEFAFIPVDPDNTDYQKFKKDVLAGAELQDAEGVVMTQEQATEFINTLP